MRQVDNLRARFGTGAMWLLLPMSLLALALGGVTVPMVLDARAREADVLAVRAAVQRLDETRERARAFEQQGRLEELGDLLERARCALPFELTVIEAFSVTRLIARDSDVELESLTVGETLELDLGSGSDDIFMRQLALGGRAEHASLMSFLATLRSCGYPHAVLEGSLSRSEVEPEQFRFQLELGFFYFAAATSAADEYDGGGAER